VEFAASSARPLQVRPGQEVRFSTRAGAGGAEVIPIQADLERFLEVLGGGIVVARARPATPAPRESPPTVPAPTAPAVPLPSGPPVPAVATTESLEELVARLYEDTRWIFDELRAIMRRGEWERALDLLDNYLSDPDSPERGEAVFLKGICLEELGRFREAYQLYLRYLQEWPQGRRASDARQGWLRTRLMR
jgi:tetratricopeptide (TPR) repeat protein